MASISKRQQARNERELHDLLQVPGNSQCADCGARNPGWASWSLGIFVCMRCASIHRKLGTHISKVKSLSMDKWTSEQVENMKRNGNTAVNNVYNPKHKNPDIPLDADEVDSAMERFIRKKYQEKSLLDGRPEPPSRDNISKPAPSSSPDNSPPPPPPPKKGRFFGFGLRASSSAYPLSKNEQKKLPQEPRVDSAFPISSDDIGAVTRMTRGQPEMSDADLQQRLIALRDMGFADNERNIFLLRKLNGNVERTVEALIQSGQGSGARDRSRSAAEQTTQMATNTAASTVSASSSSFVKAPNTSNNPFDQVANTQSFGLSTINPQHGQIQPVGTSSRISTNPFEQQTRNQLDSGLDQSFQNLQLSQPLFPNSTGGYPRQQQLSQDLRHQYSATPPVPTMNQQYNHADSLTTGGVNNNPFHNMQQQQMTGNNPYAAQVQGPSHIASSTNPFFNPQSTQMQQPSSNSSQQAPSLGTSFNPFGIPPSQSPPQIQKQPANDQYYIQNEFPTNNQRTNQFQTSPNNPFQAPNQPQVFSNPQQQSYQPFHPNQNNQPQPQLQPPFPSHPFQQQSNFYQTQQSTLFYPQQIQSQPLVPQQTGRYDKNSILALYNYPQLAPQPLPSIPEPSEQIVSNIVTQQTNSPNTSLSPPAAARRSASMPVSSMHSAGGNGNRNPFLMNTGMSPGPQSQTQMQSQTQPQPGLLARHSSRDSVNVNNLESGRHSPDAFASLSARYMG